MVGNAALLPTLLCLLCLFSFSQLEAILPVTHVGCANRNIYSQSIIYATQPCLTGFQ